MMSDSSKKKQIAAKRSLKLSSLAEDIVLPSSGQEEPFRARLHALFTQIEKEFELLYAENLSCT